MRTLIPLLSLSLLVTVTAGCQSRAAKGGAIGAAAGGAAGAIIGERGDRTAMGALIGAAIGGAAGAYIGHYMDKQAEELDRELENVSVERVAEGIKITFRSGLLFDIDRATLRPETQENLRSLAQTLQKYDKTSILIEGHTDNTGAHDYNRDLSERRARSVADFLSGLGVASARFAVRGYGETQPVAANDSADGRQQNRRVNVAIMANEELKKLAREET
ncbi:MAG: OmpA family protein [Candidatus Latescibacterota bacterium]